MWQRTRRTAGSPFRRARDSFDAVDRTQVAIVAAGLAIAIAIIFPRVLPASRQGPECTDLAAPLGGNNRSVLAESGGDVQDLDLELELIRDRVTATEGLRVILRFVNNDIGPVILYLEGGRPPITTNDTNIGIRFEIRRLDNAAAIGDEASRALPAGWPAIEPDQLHLLGSRARCSQTYDFPVTQLVPGDYRIQAFYFNDNPGVWQPNILPGDDLTPTPAYNDQGVWTRPSSISSGEVRFTVATGP